ncbi:MAG: hypothetical protein ABI193_07625 [Minicystis sp.]
MIDRSPRAPLLLSLLVPLAACQEPAPVVPAPPPRTATIPSAAPVAPAASSAPTAAPATRSDLASLLCKDGRICEIRHDRAAGQDGAGKKLRVVSVYRGVDDMGQPLPPSEPDAGPPPLGIEEKAREDIISPALGYSACQRFDYWLLSESTQGLPRATLLVTVCNEGHGASGMGEDTITVRDNHLSFTTTGGSNWRGGMTKEISLSPLRVLSVSSDSYWTMGYNHESRRWSWDDFSGTVSWQSPLCRADGSTPDPDGPPGSDTKDTYGYAPIPAVDFEGDFASSGWKDTAIDRCSLQLDAGGARGFVTHGKAGAASDASMKVVASKHNELFVEVQDDKWVGPSASWVKDDHLELWLAKELPSYFNQCLEKDLPRPQQWGIRIADGKVFAGAGKPDEKAITVEKVALSNGGARLKIGLPKGMAAISLVYSDSDDGKSQERLLATSKLVHGKVETLGALQIIESKSAVCRTEGGKLTPKLLPPGDAKAILDIE